ncbi:hypothetical protein Slin15195_G031010 [Septoria linicola]|uniref:Uncharacterized protein n=1 Tax=Septoria linicola TaxID=215465 RepID=A0A9Q9APN5_9PEZI|nr:hypothetical protein Slin14017_G030030 [Septoria linicola]USW49782.1 hypothetical protein Slin15195_G031010 [Septoria linicola]
MERIVSRADLQADQITPPSSPEITQLEHLQEFNFVHHEELPDASAAPEDDENEFVFQLFAPAAGKTAESNGVAKIRLESPDLTDAEPGLLNPDRDSRYYFTGSPSSEELQTFALAAVDGQDVLTRSKSAWPGMAYSWKVLHVPTTKKQRRLLEPSNAMFAKLMGKESVPKRTRPGKKARLAVRVKLAAAKTKQEEKQKAAEAKEVEEREKRTRRNREKKVKKKNREKAKKAEAGGADDDAAEDKKDSSEAESQHDD